MSEDGTGDPPFERPDLDIRNPVDREILAALHRARAERLAAKAHSNALRQAGWSEEIRRSRGKSRRRVR